MVSLLNNGRSRRYKSVSLAMAFAAIGYFGLQAIQAATPSVAIEAETGSLAGNAVAGDPTGASANAAVKFKEGAVGGSITNTPTQPAAFIYSDSPSAAATKAYAHPGAMVVAGRAAYADQAFKDVSAGGGSVLIYLDAMIDNNYGRYHELLLNVSECGAAVPRWPGGPKANEYGYLADFRVGGIEQGKLECVLEKMVSENPHMAGFFADDIGSRSWYPLINWGSWSTTDQQAYRDGAIALVKTFRKVADRHGLFLMVNGTWSGGALASDGGGYPDMSKSGMSLADGALVEHHDSDGPAYFQNYTCSTQWASESPLTHGKAFNWTVNNTDNSRDEFVAAGCYAFAGTQAEYSDAPPPWTGFHPTGLPNKVTTP